jgi:F-type H+-transporting ATPase subunit b
VELTWPTFVLEIVNFLILVWILQRFLYKPVLAAIAQRKAAIEKTLSDAKALQAGAHELQRQYQDRLADWESEKEKLRAVLREELSTQRENMMAALQQSLAQEREKARVVEERRLSEADKRAEEEGTAKGVRFTARLLARFASAELEARIADLFVEDLRLLPAGQWESIRAACRPDDHPIKVTTAFPLSETQRGALAQTLQESIRTRIRIEFAEDSRLITGLRVSAGPWMLRANLEDELQFFSQAVGHGSRDQ